MDNFIATLPKVELHLHLEGSLRPATMLGLAERHGVDLGATTAGELEAQYRFRNFDDFLSLFLKGLHVLRGAEDFMDATVALAAELADHNVRYAEVTTTAYSHVKRGVALGDYLEGITEGRRLAKVDYNVDLSWVCDIPREMEPADEEYTADLIIGPQAPDGVVALGLGGPEPGFPPEQFASSFAKAKAAGLGSVPHAGETEGPASVWGALRDLGADRIGHGVRSLEDPRLIEYLVVNEIPLEVSMTSNVSLGVVADIASHPLGELLDAGVAVCLNTDDPAYFTTDISTELKLAHEVHGLDAAALVRLQETALAHSFAPDALKASIGAELSALAP